MSNALFIKKTVNDLNNILSLNDDVFIKNMLKDYIESLKDEYLIQSDNRKNVKSFISYLKKTTKTRPLLQKSDYKDDYQYITNAYFGLKLSKNYYIQAIPQVTENDDIFPNMKNIFDNSKDFNQCIYKCDDDIKNIIKTCDLFKYVEIHFKATNQFFLFDSNVLKYSLCFLEGNITFKTNLNNNYTVYATDNNDNTSVFLSLRNYNVDENNVYKDIQYTVIEV